MILVKPLLDAQFCGDLVGHASELVGLAVSLSEGLGLGLGLGFAFH